MPTKHPRGSPGHGVPANCTRPRAVLSAECGFSPSSSKTRTVTLLLGSSRSQALRRPVSSDPSGEFATQTGVSPGACVATARPEGSQSCGAAFGSHGGCCLHTAENWVASASFSLHVQALASRHCCARWLTVFWTVFVQNA